MSRIIDADSHFMEPLDLWFRYIEPQYRDRCVRFERSTKFSARTRHNFLGFE